MSRPSPTIEKSLKSCLKSSGRYLVAVSGGIDSVSLLHASVSLLREYRLELAVAHIDHGLRASSSEDAKFVSELAAKYELQFFLKTLIHGPDSNIEAWGRAERYSFFAQVLTEQKFDYVLTAHNANDVAETFLMRIIANKEPNSILACDDKRKVLRPMLDVPRSVVEAYAAANQLSYREDESNRDQKFLRNKVRQTLIPFLEQNFEPRIVESLSERGTELALDHAFLYQLAEASYERVVAYDFGSSEWVKQVRAELANIAPELSWRVVELALKAKLGFNLGREQSRAVAAVLLGESRGLQLPGGIYLGLRKGELIWEQQNS